MEDAKITRERQLYWNNYRGFAQRIVQLWNLSYIAEMLYISPENVVYFSLLAVAIE